MTTAPILALLSLCLLDTLGLIVLCVIWFSRDRLRSTFRMAVASVARQLNCQTLHLSQEHDNGPLMVILFLLFRIEQMVHVLLLLGGGL